MKTGCTPSSPRSSATTAGRRPRIDAICWSDRPCLLAAITTSAVSVGAAPTCLATSRITSSWSRNQGSIPVASWSSSTVAPARSASITSWSLPSKGRLTRCRRSSTSPSIGATKSKAARGSSSERNAFPRASVKLRPIPIASPTDFICVVR